jgi:hypothetical protein
MLRVWPVGVVLATPRSTMRVAFLFPILFLTIFFTLNLNVYYFLIEYMTHNKGIIRIFQQKKSFWHYLVVWRP